MAKIECPICKKSPTECYTVCTVCYDEQVELLEWWQNLLKGHYELGKCSSLKMYIDNVLAENEKLKEALLRYGTHDENCYSVHEIIQGGPYTCNCGLDKGFKLCQSTE